jgi:hypothetical protein
VYICKKIVDIPMRIAISDARTNMLSSDFVIEYARYALIHAEHDLSNPSLLLLHAAEPHSLDFLSIQLLIATCIHTISTACMCRCKPDICCTSGSHNMLARTGDG